MIEIMQTDFFTDVKNEQNIDEMYGKYLTFLTKNQLFGVPISDVIQIVEIQEITSVPYYPDYAKGIIDLRGTIIPIIDVRIRFHMEEAEYDDRTCIIVSKIGESLIGFIVDSVCEVSEIDDKDISEPPAISGEVTTFYLTGIGKCNNKVVLLIDTKKLLTSDEMDLLSSYSENENNSNKNT